MSDTPKSILVFRAVVEFVDDLWNLYSTKGTSPLAVYRRLLQRLKEDDDESMNKVMMGFARFLVNNEQVLLANKLEEIAQGVNIRYGTSERLYIPIQKYYHKADANGRLAIRRHLINISHILDPSELKTELIAEELEELGVESNTNEGKFIADIIAEAKNSMGDVDAGDPIQATMGLVSSGILSKMMGGLQQGVESGELDPQKLFSSMQGIVGQFMSGDNPMAGNVSAIADVAKPMIQQQLALEAADDEE